MKRLVGNQRKDAGKRVPCRGYAAAKDSTILAPSGSSEGRPSSSPEQSSRRYNCQPHNLQHT